MRIRSTLAALLVLLGAVPGCSAAEPAEDPGLARFIEWRDELALPAVALVAAGAAADEKGGNRIGGAVWLPEGEAWPLSADGKRMSFLAQIDFSQLPKLPDYPESGILQFFIGTNDYYGANFEVPEKGDFRVIWREDLSEPGRFHRGEPLPADGDEYSPLSDATVERGVALRGQPVTQKPTPSHWRYAIDLPDVEQGESADLIYEFLDRELERTGEPHHVGGHPEFTQWDYRGAEGYQDVDRVLLQLWSDDHLMWGDSGQGQFTIRRADLLKRDFSKVLYQWDGH
jgi:uncharacterized protein YwqG